MFLHDSRFLRIQPAFFQEYRVGHGNLADVVQEAAPFERGQIVVVESERTSERGRIRRKALTVPLRARIARFNRRTQAKQHRFSRTSDRMRACSSAVSNGLVTKSSAPASMPFNLSCLSRCEVTITMGMNRVAVFSFSCRQISKPWPCGATRSISTRSGGCVAQALNTASADCTTETLCPSRVRRRFRNRELVSSSSAMRIDAGAFTIDLTMQDKGRGSALVLVICQ